MDPLKFLAEKKIQEALRRGELDDLPGKGKPVEIDSNPFVPQELRLAHKVLKNAGLIPQEVSLYKEINTILHQLAENDLPEETRRLLKKSLHEKQIALDILLKRTADYQRSR